MRTYQTLSLIGCIIGIFLMLGLACLVGGLMRVSDVLLNMSRPTESEIQEQAVKQTSNSAFVGGVLIAFFIYIAILVVTFAVKTKTKAVGITILILGLLGMATTNLWGIIPFALLLPAGISALRYKRELAKPSSDSHEE
jgi:cytochrome bd-type quinol oxidase subunit 2